MGVAKNGTAETAEEEELHRISGVFTLFILQKKCIGTNLRR